MRARLTAYVLFALLIATLLAGAAADVFLPF
jgi:hypothetical protein